MPDRGPPGPLMVCRPERSEGPHRRLPGHEILRCAQDDSGSSFRNMIQRQEPKPPRRVGFLGAPCSNRPRAADVPVEVEARPTPVGAGLLLSAARRLVLLDRIELPDDTGSSSGANIRTVRHQSPSDPSFVGSALAIPKRARTCVRGGRRGLLPLVSLRPRTPSSRELTPTPNLAPPSRPRDQCHRRSNER
jgi:hypothetical protein